MRSTRSSEAWLVYYRRAAEQRRAFGDPFQRQARRRAQRELALLFLSGVVMAGITTAFVVILT